MATQRADLRQAQARAAPLPPLFLFDGHCVLCTSGVGWLMRHPRARWLHFASAQSPLGERLFDHFGEDWDATYLLVADGRALGRSDGYLEIARRMGGPWHLARVLRIIPRRWRDAAYDLLARNRYRWFGSTAEHCALLTPEQRQRLLHDELQPSS